MAPPASPMAPRPWALMPSLRASGPRQMDLDCWMLEQLTRGHGPGAVLRFYRWDKPCISLGHHQSSLGFTSDLPVVRRPTGGAAVLHGGDLCYAVALAEPPGGPRATYGLISQWLQRGFERLGNPLRPGTAGQDRQLINCFASGTAADLLGTKGEKRIGSAQLWRRGLLLQHGSIQLNPDPGLWRMLFNQEAPQALPLGGAIEAELRAEAQAWLFGTQPEELPLPAITSGSDATLWAIGAKAMPMG